MRISKSFETVQEHIEPADPDMAAIRKHTLRDFQPDEVWCGQQKLCHTRVDRSHEQFSLAYLERFAETLPGKSLLGGHDYGSLPLGRYYAASVVPEGDGAFLKASYFVRADSPIVPDIELGILKDVSIGFNAGKRTCNLCEKAWDFTHEHFPGQEYDGKTCTLTYCPTEAHKAEAMEGSFVWHGCQPGAEAMAMAKTLGVSETQFQRFYALGGGISLPFPPTESRQESNMLRFKTHEEAEAEVKRLEALPLAAAREAELQKAIADKEPLARDGAAYRAHLKAEILRMAGAIDEANKNTVKGDQYKAILAHMEDATAETLAAVLKGIEPEFSEKFAGGAGKTDVPEPEDTTRTKPKTSPFGRFGLGGLY